MRQSLTCSTCFNKVHGRLLTGNLVRSENLNWIQAMPYPTTFRASRSYWFPALSTNHLPHPNIFCRIAACLLTIGPVGMRSWTELHSTPHATAAGVAYTISLGHLEECNALYLIHLGSPSPLARDPRRRNNIDSTPWIKTSSRGGRRVLMYRYALSHIYARIGELPPSRRIMQRCVQCIVIQASELILGSAHRLIRPLPLIATSRVV
jgi:hypothetical protein